MYKFVQDSGV